MFSISCIVRSPLWTHKLNMQMPYKQSPFDFSDFLGGFFFVCLLIFVQKSDYKRSTEWMHLHGILQFTDGILLPSSS